MTALLEILRGIIKLFVEDELLAAGVVVVVGLTALLTVSMPEHPFVAGFALVGGNIAVLVAGAVHTRTRGRRTVP
jgi:hypothetical protein